jgi:UDP-N-acetylglucosamine 2-epimerase (non-hydrolysing)
MFLVLIGTKAQLVKMAPVLHEFYKLSVPHKFILTGQHSETIDDLIEDFQLKKPDLNLVPDNEADSKLKLVKWLFLAWKRLIALPDIKQAQNLIVHGDTLSTLLGAIAGKRLGIPIVHVEAGLRSFSLLHPFPEELVRIIVSRFTNIHFAPGLIPSNHLLKRNGVKNRVINTEQNTILDSLRFVLNSIVISGDHSPYCVVSLHRSENLGSKKRFQQLMKFTRSVSLKIKVKFVLHPVTKIKLDKKGWIDSLSNERIEFINRMNYVSFINLLACSKFLITDGGSNQEEAAYMGLPCLIARHKTERDEGIGKNAVLSNFDAKIMDRFVEAHHQSNWTFQPLPDTKPSEIITSKLLSLYCEGRSKIAPVA